MEREQEELQSLGFFGIIKESFKIIFSKRKIFSQITLALILPLSFIFLAHIQVSQLLFFKILDHEQTLDHTQKDTPNYSNLSDRINSEWIAFWLFKAAYFTFLLILSLLSTSAVVYTIACIYTAKEITFKKVMSVVPKVWKRLMVTFLWSFFILLVYNIVAIGLITLLVVLIASNVIGIVIIVLLLILYLMGFVYLSIVWQLASVVSVLEDVYGIQAMIKSKTLIKGKMGVAIGFFILLFTCFVAIAFVFEDFVVFEMVPDLGIRIGVGILCFLFLVKVILFALVVQTVVYFVCKSYHHQNIDKSALSDHLEVYLGDYVRLKKDVQLGELDHV
uniref:Transmembrane protein n=1 Tax=Fagus sylvatica TaxID=28930 RepID=A0A2N9HV56_FAGSY